MTSRLYRVWGAS